MIAKSVSPNWNQDPLLLCSMFRDLASRVNGTEENRWCQNLHELGKRHPGMSSDPGSALPRCTWWYSGSSTQFMILGSPSSWGYLDSWSVPSSLQASPWLSLLPSFLLCWMGPHATGASLGPSQAHQTCRSPQYSQSPNWAIRVPTAHSQSLLCSQGPRCALSVPTAFLGPHCALSVPLPPQPASSLVPHSLPPP
jgi:hypothetical protein